MLPCASTTRLMATRGTLRPVLAKVAYTWAMSYGRTSAPPSTRLRPRFLPESGPQVVMPILVARSTAAGTPTYSSVLTAGMLIELPSAVRSVIWPWNWLSKFDGHHWWPGASSQHVGWSSIDVPGAQPLRKAAVYTTGLIDEPGWRS